MERRPKSIKLRREKPFEEEPLPQQTLLHIYFEDNYGNPSRWTPRWVDAEKIFFKALEVEEKNNPEGAWTEELEKAAKRVPSLKEFKLPVKIGLRRLQELSEGGWKYKVRIEILPAEAPVGIGDRHGVTFYIGNCVFRMESIVDALKEAQDKWGILVGRYCIRHYDEGSGVSFEMMLKESFERLEYQITLRESVGAIRTYIRTVLLDAKAIEKAFEEEREDTDIPF